MLLGGADNPHFSGGRPSFQGKKRGLKDTGMASEALRDFLAVVEGWVEPRILGVDNTSTQTGGRQGRGTSPQCLSQSLYLPSSWSSMTTAFYGAGIPSPPLPCLGCSFIAEISDSPRNFTPLCLCSLAVPSAKCLPHCPCLSTTSSFFKAQLGCYTSST